MFKDLCACKCIHLISTNFTSFVFTLGKWSTRGGTRSCRCTAALLCEFCQWRNSARWCLSWVSDQEWNGNQSLFLYGHEHFHASNANPTSITQVRELSLSLIDLHCSSFKSCILSKSSQLHDQSQGHLPDGVFWPQAKNQKQIHFPWPKPELTKPGVARAACVNPGCGISAVVFKQLLYGRKTPGSNYTE